MLKQLWHTINQLLVIVMDSNPDNNQADCKESSCAVNCYPRSVSAHGGASVGEGGSNFGEILQLFFGLTSNKPADHSDTLAA